MERVPGHDMQDFGKLLDFIIWGAAFTCASSWVRTDTVTGRVKKAFAEHSFNKMS